MAVGVATTTRAQVKGYRKAPTFVRRHLIPTNVPMSLIEVGWEAVRPRGLCRELLEERSFDLFIGNGAMSKAFIWLITFRGTFAKTSSDPSTPSGV